MTSRKRAVSVVGALSACAALATSVAGAGAANLDDVKLKAEPGGIPTKIAAVANKKGEIFVTIATKKGGKKFEQRDKDAAEVNVRDGRVSLEAGQEGESYSRNGGEGLLSVGDDYAEYFRWNAKRGNIGFYSP